MIAEELFQRDPESFCKLMQAMEERYQNMPLFVIYYHQFALAGEVDFRKGNNIVGFFIDEYTEQMFPELAGYYSIELFLSDNGEIKGFVMNHTTEQVDAEAR